MSRTLPHLLSPDPASPFPPAEHALREPDGLLAIGGDLHPQRLLNAYAHGIFPWFSDGQPLLWWSPNPRTVLRTDTVHLSSRFRRQLRTCTWTLRADTAFAQVIAACASSPRPGQDGTWITDQMQEAYLDLHRRGYAHSVEVFDGARLVGGIYGVAIGQMFFGESMFSGASGGSKIALAALAAELHGRGWPLIDAQVENPHLMRLGAQRLPREQFLQHVATQVALPEAPGSWTQRYGERHASGLAGVRLT
ncbi:MULTISPECIES: leucyl/phenylalanyl-tRNA--protein transferase [Xanthomonas]|uniref:leucyl/phenylalanyl-tRNA--protein transferase n=1 Tax=Xanthomonas TaxID=338 RepID=UPI00096D4976|nr:leucyl/phenylalanyl-tRNA--protein transferase [Xanthomonas campestris]MCC5093213.1 leucyl/phenylalanyl-tRNA--protein transferase [Xanthomonas campestris pv. incanae]MEA9610798.1 leucyl/phenylalanyl-tRNA--protein transferase [Xanthomonas campestris pv. incanae]MEA9617943.1 leucyl/phenylalanyl-tRNA--protein transferase [Xanthomonas campestris pv. incanae]RFF45412.1 leucyl/phenylalanyl-tRNA--protein transferase [Xanthomonas campestris pv. incanae]WDJ11588.1 leucyl/phenylalanyl-tRNA--protein tr